MTFFIEKQRSDDLLGMNPESNHGTPNPDELMNQMDANNDGKLSSREMNGPL